MQGVRNGISECMPKASAAGVNSRTAIHPYEIGERVGVDSQGYRLDRRGKPQAGPSAKKGVNLAGAALRDQIVETVAIHLHCLEHYVVGARCVVDCRRGAPVERQRL